jgi:hypothetical protein
MRGSATRLSIGCAWHQTANHDECGGHRPIKKENFRISGAIRANKAISREKKLLNKKEKITLRSRVKVL